MNSKSTPVRNAAFDSDIQMMAFCKSYQSHCIENQPLISSFCSVRQLRFTSPSLEAGCQSITEVWPHPSSRKRVPTRGVLSPDFEIFSVKHLGFYSQALAERYLSIYITVHKVNTINLFVDAVVWACLCVCRLLGLRDGAVNIVQQTLMKRRETETCWQTLSAPTTGFTDWC